jgi:hypothetical protein
MRSGVLSLTLSLAAAVAAQEPSPIGVWRGPVRLADGTTVELLVTIAADAAGALTGTLDVPAQATFALPLTDLAVGGSEVTFTVPDLPGAPGFQARLAADGSRLTGTMRAEEAPAPATDIYLARVAEGWTVSEVVNATAREGYDSQPAFLPDGAAFLYTSQREGQTDIYRYDLAAGESVPVTVTAEAEYSPTPMAGGTHFSTVRVEVDGTQHLWRFPLAGGEPELMLPDVAPVGYHAWLDATTVALFVLGEPPTLRLARLGEPGARTLAENIGRCLARVPGTETFSYVDKTDEESWQVMLADAADGSPRALGSTLEGSEDYAWTPSGELLMGQASKLFLGSTASNGLTWREIADLAGAGVAGITRLALSPDGRWLALVGETPAPPPAAIESAFEWVRISP